jgi:hypothetical protein
MTLPPDSFYYVLSFLFGGALIWVIKISIHKTDAILKSLAETVADLKTIVAVHENKHEDEERRLDLLESGKSKKGK